MPQTHAAPLPLWPDAAPGALGTAESDRPELTAFLPPAGTANGASMLILPGGGYAHLSVHEGAGYAAWLNRLGVTCYVLKYRLGSNGYRHPAMLQDAARALRTVRAWARRDGLDPARVGIIGSSAGGHLASTATVHFETIETRAPNAVTGQSSRPDFSILIYPVISMEEGVHRGSKKNLMGETPAAGLPDYFSSQKHVKADTQPAFLAHALDDKVVPIENSRMFYEAQKKAGLPTRLIELPSGGHGLNGYKGPSWDKWQAESLLWLKEIKVLP